MRALGALGPMLKQLMGAARVCCVGSQRQAGLGCVATVVGPQGSSDHHLCIIGVLVELLGSS